MPRINLGPCGRFAKAFREQWNARFPDKINIAFVMSGDGSQCHHVVVRLPDGSFYDGGNGLMSKQTLLGLFSGSRIDEMVEFDLKLLDQRSYGLSRDYPVCPNYSDETTARLIESCLAQLRPMTLLFLTSSVGMTTAWREARLSRYISPSLL